MTTSLLITSFDSEYNKDIIKTKFAPTRKYDNSSYYVYEKENFEINSDISDREQILEKNKINQISFLFPSMPIKVSYYFFNYKYSI